jgi:DNA-binding CsgD family transcriptional regulator
MQQKLSLLTGREREVLALAAKGLRSREIAARLEISEPTVKTHLHHAYRKLGVTNRVEATNVYMRSARAKR